jgi:hypothetical protein
MDEAQAQTSEKWSHWDSRGKNHKASQYWFVYQRHVRKWMRYANRNWLNNQVQKLLMNTKQRVKYYRALNQILQHYNQAGFVGYKGYTAILLYDGKGWGWPGCGY